MGTWLNRPVDLAPLAVFRMLLGGVLLFSTIRFAANGWIETQIIEPQLYFPYFGWEWLPRPADWLAYGLFGLLIAAALGMMLGFFYRISTVVFFLGFTYVELLDKSNYLNHYYLVSLLVALMILLPANRTGSLDAKFGRVQRKDLGPWWTVNIVRVMLSSVYFFAGIAKLNTAWLLEAQPLAIWLPQHSDLPVIGPVLDEPWAAYVFSWGGAAFDLLVPFALWIPRARGFAYAAVLVFHVLTGILFPIGVFPIMMMCCTLVFFPAPFHRRVLSELGAPASSSSSFRFSARGGRLMTLIIGAFLLFHLVFPFRYLLYPGDLFWNEEGYRFSWRVMLMEKSGKAFFYVKEEGQPGEKEVLVSRYLTPNQEKQMATQPDMVLYFAHWIGAHYADNGVSHPKVRAEVWVNLNGRGSQLMVDPFTNLLEIQDGFRHQDWVLPHDSIITLSAYNQRKSTIKAQSGW